MDAFFESRQGQLWPSPEARSPWSEQMLHGRLLAALVAREVEHRRGSEGMLPVRVTVDLFRAAPLRPVQLRTRVIRDGRRVKVAECVVECEGQEVALASVLLLRSGPAPAGRVWSPPPWEVPSPEVLPEPAPVGEGRSFPMDIRHLDGAGFSSSQRRRAWVRESRLLVAGEALSPFVRAVAAADLANPFANAGSAGLSFINADLSVYLGRLPVGEWIGLEVTSHVSAAGVAVGSCDLHDGGGRIGSATVASVANAPMGS